MSARLDLRLPEVVELATLNTAELDPLFQEEIQVWEKRFDWDFRPSADLLRRFVQLHSLSGYALVSGQSVAGYTYFVTEGRKGLIGDFFLRSEYATSSNEMSLLGATVQGLMLVSGIRRIETQLMTIRMPLTQPLPFSQYASRYDRLFMEVDRGTIARLAPATVGHAVKFHAWAERFNEEIAHLVAAAYRGHIDSEINDQYRTIPGARHFLGNIIRYPGCGTFSAEGSVVAIDSKSGRVCGAALASTVSPTSGHITQLCILPAIRGARLGYELLRQALVRLSSLGCGTVSLTVTASNAGAIRLYESVGFRSVSTFPALVWEGF
ncbi:MAG TPA: GNAT family N-acetyltransferase [Bryobacteraceae bacterium]|jgi:ribosomal protein S18 acetylase RimI-like enzyme|nr:GNAT family N-acetyltransferase [Bryobacteraceae bacterium]